MKFLIQNNTSENKNIVRFGGELLNIPAHDFVEFDSDDATECKYWNKIMRESCIDITVITDISRIRLLKKLKRCGKYNGSIKKNISKKTVKLDTTTNSTLDNTEETTLLDVSEIMVPDSFGDVEQDTNIFEEKSLPEETEQFSEELPIISEEQSIISENPTLYTKETLSNKNKEELQDILDSLGVEYRKNSSTTKLINTILENCN